jgi:hypothetical protein
MLLMFAALLGIFCGLNYSFLILVPVSLVVGLTCGAQALIDGRTILSAFGAIILPAFSIQAGYVIGLVARETKNQFLTRLHGVQSRQV